MFEAIGPPKIAMKMRRPITTPPMRAALSWWNRSQKSRDGLLRSTATGCSATAPPEVTWNSGGFVIRNDQGYNRALLYAAILMNVHRVHDTAYVSPEYSSLNPLLLRRADGTPWLYAERE